MITQADGYAAEKNARGGDVAIRCRDVRFSYGSHQVLKGVDLEVPKGCVFGLLGPNGAGKSTLISIASGLRRPDSGGVEVLGVDVVADPLRARRRIGLAPQDLGIFPQLTVRRNIMAFLRLRCVHGDSLRREAGRLIDMLELDAFASREAGMLSGGQKRRLHTAMALAGDPAVVFLDEPTVGADVDSRRRIIGLVGDLAAQGRTVVYTTHYLDELRNLDPFIVVINHGVVVASGRAGELIDRHAHPSVRVLTDGEAPAVPGWTSSGRSLSRTVVGGDVTDTMRSLLADLATTGSHVVDMTITHADLEAAYTAIVHDDGSKGGER